jgi:hypothetical protein
MQLFDLLQAWGSNSASSGKCVNNMPDKAMQQISLELGYRNTGRNGWARGKGMNVNGY